MERCKFNGCDEIFIVVRLSFRREKVAVLPPASYNPFFGYKFSPQKTHCFIIGRVNYSKEFSA